MPNIWIYIICFVLPVMSLLVFGMILMLQNLFTAPYVPSSARKLEKLLAELNLDPTSNFIDIGSGDGGIVLMAANYFASSSGVEINPYLWLISQLRAQLHKLFKSSKHQIKFHCHSFFHHKFDNYQVMYIYLFPEIMIKLEDKIFAEMPAGSTIISHTFKFAKHQPQQVIGKHYLVYKV